MGQGVCLGSKAETIYKKGENNPGEYKTKDSQRAWGAEFDKIMLSDIDILEGVKQTLIHSFPYGYPAYYKIIAECCDTHCKKSHDYAGDNRLKSLDNFRMSEDIDIPAYKGVFVRLIDKFNRIKTLMKTESAEVTEETVLDTLKDLANYAILMAVLYEEGDRSIDDNC